MLPMHAGMPARTGSLSRDPLAAAHDNPQQKRFHGGKAKRGALGDLVNHMIHVGPSLDCADGVDKADLHMGSATTYTWLSSPHATTRPSAYMQTHCMAMPGEKAPCPVGQCKNVVPAGISLSWRISIGHQHASYAPFCVCRAIMT